MKKILMIIISVIMIINSCLLSTISTYAHSYMLNIECDICNASYGEGIDKMWYVLDDSMHISHETKTIKYYFEPRTAIEKEGEEVEYYYWNTNISDDEANAIKTAYANSMKKWNNVYYYSYDSSGNLIKNKIIDVVEGTATDHNLSIFPAYSGENIAETIGIGNGETIENGDSEHKHYSQWKMTINISYFEENASNTQDVNAFKERVGAHELGHVLGLSDVDLYCTVKIGNEDVDHHHELLMGYGEPKYVRNPDITYKDIAGVAIARGFHTDSDHKWLNVGFEHGKYKLICSVCNGMKKVSSLSGYTYDDYNCCQGNHNLSQGNMMAVACYGDMDYYKCKYCKYVAPFSALIQQDHTDLAYYNDKYHMYNNIVCNLEYTILVEHSVNPQTHRCSVCNFYVHTYGPYTYNGYTNHIRTCSCGLTQTESHYVCRHDIIDGRYAMCLGCNRLLDLNSDMSNIIDAINIKYSVNGSYLLPSGIAVLVDEDMEAYLNGTLQFYNENDLPVTQ